MAKAVRMADIAQRLGISTVSVSKGLAGKEGVSAEMRAKILAVAEEMGYQPPARAHTQPGGESIGGRSFFQRERLLFQSVPGGA